HLHTMYYRAESEANFSRRKDHSAMLRVLENGARGKENVMTRILAVANQKGGVGKTTTTVNLAASISHADHRVLVVDMDPQANATSGLGFPKGTLTEGIYEGLAPLETGIAPRPLRELTQLTEVPNLWLVPSTRD